MPMKNEDPAENNVEQSQETAEPPIAVSREDLDKVNRLATELITALNSVDDGDMVAEVVENALKLLRDKTNRGDSDKEFLIGPSFQYRPSPRSVIDFAPLFGCTHDSPEAKIYIVFGWEF